MLPDRVHRCLKAELHLVPGACLPDEQNKKKGSSFERLMICTTRQLGNGRPKPPSDTSVRRLQWQMAVASRRLRTVTCTAASEKNTQRVQRTCGGKCKGC